MSLLDLDQLTPADLVVQYVLECRGCGHFLPYLDYQVINEWVNAAGDADRLLLILSDVLPGFYARARETAKAPPLIGARKLVLRRLRDQAMRQGVRA